MSPAPGARLKRLEQASVALWLVVTAACLAIVGPFATNDGPVHISFAHMLWSGLGGGLQSRVYALQPQLDPNLLSYFIAGPLIPLVGADRAETILQILCLTGLPAAGLFAIGAFPARTRAWAIGLVGLGLNFTFFLGLYNFSLSLAAGLAAFGMAVRAQARGGLWWLGFGAALVVAFLAHAAGLILGVVFSAVWILPGLAEDLTAGAGLRTLASRYGPAVLAALPVLVLIGQFALRQRHGEVIYGTGLIERIKLMVRLGVLATNGRLSALAGEGLAALVIGGASIAAAARLRAWADPASRLETVRLTLLMLASLALALGFPDVAGGGFSHVLRMVLFPYIAAMILCSAHDWNGWSRVAIAAGASLASGVLLGAAVHEQALARPVVGELDGLLGRVGAHCTVLPLITVPAIETVDPPQPATARSFFQVSRTLYTPFSHVATRLELQNDRVSLYNFLARLGVYPIVDRSGVDTQALIFHWRSRLAGGAIATADPQAFEAATGIPVHYLLVQGPVADLAPGLVPALAGRRLVASSARAGFHLYARDGVRLDAPCPPGLKAVPRG